MDFLKAMNDFYYYMSLYELRMMNGGDAYGGLSYNSMLYVNVISQMRDCTVSKMAQALGVTKPAVTLKVSELERQGVLQKTQSEVDKRVHYLTLTPKMEHTLGLYDAVFQDVGTRLQEAYTAEELALFGRVLRTIFSCEWKEIEQP